ncbi:Stress responsive alpha-beta barrel [Sesbania bispinosa]|nr:Stress responsive alpha-beta barrel [Sesbania bispinosa]
MQSLSTSPSLSLTFLPSKHGKPSSGFKPYRQCPPYKPRSSIKMSSTTQGVEHIVLFRAKDNAESSKVNAMVNELRSLVTLDQVRHLTVGPILRNIATTTVSSSELRFTHLLHSRYDSIEDLESYTAHPSHLSAVRESVFPICDDLMAVDWVAGNAALQPHPPLGSAIRVRFLKLKDNAGGEVKDEVLGVLREMKNLSCGENVSPARAKGFSIASLAVFPGQRELEGVDPNEGLVKVKEHLESVVVVDYVVQ